MRPFLFGLCLSSLLTVSSSFVYGQDHEITGGSFQPLPRARFEMTPTQQYIMARARIESEQRAELGRYYDSIGFDYGAPQITTGFYYSAVPPIRYRRFYSFNGSFGMLPSGYGF